MGKRVFKRDNFGSRPYVDMCLLLTSLTAKSSRNMKKYVQEIGEGKGIGFKPRLMTMEGVKTRSLYWRRIGQ